MQPLGKQHAATKDRFGTKRAFLSRLNRRYFLGDTVMKRPLLVASALGIAVLACALTYQATGQQQIPPLTKQPLGPKAPVRVAPGAVRPDVVEEAQAPARKGAERIETTKSEHDLTAAKSSDQPAPISRRL